MELSIINNRFITVVIVAVSRDAIVVSAALL